MRIPYRRACIYVLTTALVFLFCGSAAAFIPPARTSHVIDQSGRIEAADRVALDAHLHAIQEKSGRQLAALVLSSLNGEPIEDVAYATAKAWGIGHAGDDDGVLFVVALDDRRVRIEVGKGVEGLLPDLKCSDIIRESMAPSLRQGEPDLAIALGADAVLKELGDASTGANVETVASNSVIEAMAIVVGVFLCLFLLAYVRRSYVRRRDQPFDCRGENEWWPEVTSSPTSHSGRGFFSPDSSSSFGDGGSSFEGSSSAGDSLGGGGGDSFGGGDFGGGGASGDF